MNKAKKDFLKTTAEQSAWMIGAALLTPVALALTPAAIVLRDKCEKMTEAQKAKSKLPGIHAALATPLVFCAFTLIQGPQVIAGSYERAYKGASKR